MQEMISNIWKILNTRLFTFFLVLLSAVIMFSMADHKYGYTSSEVRSSNCINSDGTQYYAYLPMYFIYPDQKDFGFGEEIRQRYDKRGVDKMVFKDDSNPKEVNKAYIGTPVLQAPFFYCAHVLHQWNNWNTDGYDLGYRFSIQLAALFYWMLGVFALLKLFTRLGFSRFSVLMSCLIITFGANLNYYVSFAPSMSHVYAFSMIACFLNIAHSWVIENSWKKLLLAFFILGLVTLVRPVNFIIILIVPFFFSSWKQFSLRFLELIQKRIGQLLVAILLFLLPILLQLSAVYDITGKLGLYTYPGEGFTNALHPEIINVLFSFHKGFFIYAPVFFILFIAYYYFFRYSNRYFVLGWSMLISLWIYIISSWWCWDYGGGLGMRTMVDLFPLLLFPLLALFKFSHKIILTFTIVFCVLCSGMYQIYQLQYTRAILDCCAMDGNNYWDVFMKTDKRYQWMIDFNKSREHLPQQKLPLDFKVDFRNGSWQNPKNILTIRTDKYDYMDKGTLSYDMDGTEEKHYAKMTGKILISNPNCNPFVSIEYFYENERIEQSIFTIGTNIDNPYSYEKFEIEVNHPLTNYKCDKIEVNIHNGGCESQWKNLEYSKFKD